MPLTTEQLRALARACVSPEPAVRTTALEALGDPDAADLAADAVQHLDDPDRNIRVAALRVLAWCEGPDAVNGLLRGLDDPVKRVREVAAKSTPRFLADGRIVERLKQALDRDESGSAKPAAEVLAGTFTSPHGLTIEQPRLDVMRDLIDIPKHRQRVLVALLRAPTLSADMASLLRDVVTHGTKDEAVAATRRLCGFRVAHHAELDPDIRRRADRAWGDVYFWIRADG